MSEMLGNAGQGLRSGRPLDYEDLEERPSPEPSLAMPPMCLRSLSSTRPGCGINCPGQQRDGTCLADLVRSEWAVGRSTPHFEIDHEGIWNACVTS